jgi:hypothetical protein
MRNFYFGHNVFNISIFPLQFASIVSQLFKESINLQLFFLQEMKQLEEKSAEENFNSLLACKQNRLNSKL